MKKFLSFFLFLLYVSIAYGQKVDTTYYDAKWRGVKFKELATYVRFDFNFNDPLYDNKCRIFYTSGQLQAEGVPLIHDKLDGTKSTWKGEFTEYYPNGSKRMVCNFDNEGRLNGKSTTWQPNGNLLSEQNFKDGLLDGTSVTLDEANPEIWYVTKFEKGQPINNESLQCDKSGRMLRVDFNTRELILEKPKREDCKLEFKDGIANWFYDMNGIFISLNFAKTKMYGKYYQCYLMFVNNTNDPIEINPDNISGYSEKKGETKMLELISADDYLKKIARTQAWSAALAGASSSLNNRNAGYSSTTTTGVAVGTYGYASGSSTSTTYNPAERRAVMNEEQKKLDQMNQANKQVLESIDGAILKRTVVQPGEQIYKSFYIHYVSAEKIVVNFLIGKFTYVFEMETN